MALCRLVQEHHESVFESRLRRLDFGFGWQSERRIVIRLSNESNATGFGRSVDDVWIVEQLGLELAGWGVGGRIDEEGATGRERAHLRRRTVGKRFSFAEHKYMVAPLRFVQIRSAKHHREVL